MDTKIFRFYEAFKSHEFTEEQLNDVVEGMKTIIKDESQQNATKGDIEALSKATRADIETLSKATRADIEALSKATRADIEALSKATRADIEALRNEITRLSERMSDKFQSLVIWVVSTGIAITGIIIAVVKLL